MSKIHRTYPCERGRWSVFRICSKESHRSGLQSEHSYSSSSCSWLVTRRNEIFYCCPSPSSFDLFLSLLFGSSRNFVSCPRSFRSDPFTRSILFSLVCFELFLVPCFRASFTFECSTNNTRMENMWLDVTRVYIQLHSPRAKSLRKWANNFTKISKKKSCYHCTRMEIRTFKLQPDRWSCFGERNSIGVHGRCCGLLWRNAVQTLVWQP